RDHGPAGRDTVAGSRTARSIRRHRRRGRRTAHRRRETMSLRTRLLLAFAAVVLVAIPLPVVGLRQEVAKRLSHEYQLRVDQVVDIIREDLARESAAIAERLA